MKIADKVEPPTYWQRKRGEVMKRRYGYGQFEGNINLVIAIALALGTLCLMFMAGR